MRDICISVFLLVFNAGAYSQWSTDPSENTRVTNGGLLPQIITDGTGGAYIVYQDSPALLRQVWVQSLDKLGSLRFPDNGIRISSADRNQSPHYYLVSDSAGGVIVLFEERHLVGDPFDEVTFNAIYVQRIDSSGTKLWGDTGIEISPFADGERKSAISACSDGASGAFVFWGEDADSNGAFELRAQRISADGQLAWPDSGLVVTGKFIFDNISNSNPVVSSGFGDALILYSDSSQTNFDTKLQKIDGQGDFLWGEGVDIFTIGRQMKGDFAGGAIVAGVRREFDSVSVKYIIRAQRIDAAGEMPWGDNGVVITDLGDDLTRSVEIISDKEKNRIFVWHDKRSGNFDLYAQRLNADGEIQWIKDGVKVSNVESSKTIFFAGNAPDQMSGAIIIWIDERNSDSGLFSPDALFAQRIDENGSQLWDETDVAVSLREVQHNSYKVISDLAGGAITCWYETGTGSGFGIFAQQVSRNGILGEVLVTSVSQRDESFLPTQFALHQSYPNPFNAEMTIKYEIPKSNHVTLAIYDITGKEVITILEEKQSPGHYQINWNGKNMKGGEVASGIYIYQLCTGSFVKSKKAILIK